MNVLDIIIIAALIFFVVRGIFRGFVREIGSLAGVVLGIWLANLYLPEVTKVFELFLPPGRYLPLLCFALIFLVVLVLCNLLAWWLKKFFQKIFLGWADRVLGAGLAVIKGVFLSYFIIVLLMYLVAPKSPIIADSRLKPVIVSAYQSLVGVISSDAQEKLKKRLESQKKKIEDTFRGHL